MSEKIETRQITPDVKMTNESIWNSNHTLRWLLIGIAGTSMAYNYASHPVLFYGSALVAGGIGLYQFMRTHEIMQANKQRTPTQIPCSDCKHPCPLKDLAADTSLKKAIQQQKAYDHLVTSSPEMIPTTANHRTEFRIGRFVRYLKWQIGTGIYGGQSGISCDMRLP